MATNWNVFKNTVFAESKEQRKRLLTEPTIHDIYPYFDSGIVDVENCLRFDLDNSGVDSGDWASYLANPVPYIIDLLLDFGDETFWNQVPPCDRRDVAVAAAKRWAGQA